MFCPKCGNEIPDESNSCLKCGSLPAVGVELYKGRRETDPAPSPPGKSEELGDTSSAMTESETADPALEGGESASFSSGGPLNEIACGRCNGIVLAGTGCAVFCETTRGTGANHRLF